MKNFMLALSCSLLINACSRPENSNLNADSPEDLDTQGMEAFKTRAQSREAVQAARASILALMQKAKSSTGKTPFNLIDLYLRTFTFEAEHHVLQLADGPRPLGVNSEPIKEAVRLMSDGARAAEDWLNPAVVGYPHPAYYYFKARAMIGASLYSVAYLLSNQTALSQTIDAGLKSPGGVDFEGGGLLRLQAELFSNTSFNFTYFPEEAGRLIDKALKAEAYPDTQLSGDLICENFTLKNRIESINCARRNDCQPAIEAERPAAELNKLFAQQEILFNFRSYLQDNLMPEVLRFETIDCVKSFRYSQPKAYEIFKWKVEQVPGLQKYKDSIDSNTVAWELLTKLKPAFEAYETIMESVAHDVETNEGIISSLGTLKECADGGTPEAFCTTRMDNLVADPTLSPEQRQKLDKLQKLLDSKDLNAEILKCPVSDLKCAPALLKKYLVAKDIQILDEVRASLGRIKDAPAQYQNYVEIRKKCEEDLFFLNHASRLSFTDVKAKALCNKGEPEQVIDDSILDL